MPETFSELDEKLVNFITEQKIIFIATAPDNIKEGYVSLSPKGCDTLAIIDNRTLAYGDYSGSENETATNLRQNGKLTMMFLSFGETPMILRLFGRGEVVELDSPSGKELQSKMTDKMSRDVRHFIVMHIEKAKTGCGDFVPRYQFIGHREHA